MHGLIKERLEDYLHGAPHKVPSEFEEHLHDCDDCREAVSRMREQGQLLRVLSARRDIDPAPGFYARLLERIEAQPGASVWSIFLLDPAFRHRVAAASLTLACLLGGYLAFTEARGTSQPANDEAIMAVQEHPDGLGLDQQRDRDTILVTLATYSE